MIYLSVYYMRVVIAKISNLFSWWRYIIWLIDCCLTPWQELHCKIISMCEKIWHWAWFVDRCLFFCPFSFWPLCCLSLFYLRILITPYLQTLLGLWEDATIAKWIILNRCHGVFSWQTRGNLDSNCGNELRIQK